jgi:aspartyl-tRNA(Asn)/glutamyl-tRNA(Gln) amidotransferase subunit C
MMEIKDIEKLAKLARIELSEAEKQAYLKDMSAILNYVDQIKEIVGTTSEEKKAGYLRNVTRLDESQDQDQDKARAIIAEFPRQERNYLKVKKILEN